MRAREIQAVVSRISGVISTNVNIVTDSLLIHYDPVRIDASSVVHAMTASGLLPAMIDAEKPPAQLGVMAKSTAGIYWRCSAAHN